MGGYVRGVMTRGVCVYPGGEGCPGGSVSGGVTRGCIPPT